MEWQAQTPAHPPNESRNWNLGLVYILAGLQPALDSLASNSWRQRYFPQPSPVVTSEPDGFRCGGDGPSVNFRVIQRRNDRPTQGASQDLFCCRGTDIRSESRARLSSGAVALGSFLRRPAAWKLASELASLVTAPERTETAGSLHRVGAAHPFARHLLRYGLAGASRINLLDGGLRWLLAIIRKRIFLDGSRR